MRPLPLLVIAGLHGGNLDAQPAGKAKTEPGLEQAVDWKWWVAPAASTGWGIPLPDPSRPATPGEAGPIPVVAPRPDTYQVVKGDALIKIATKFDMTVPQLKQFNGLKDDRIKIGQTLRIPTLEQVLAMAPPPPPPKPKKEEAKKEPEPEETALTFDQQLELETVRLQVFLDREQFSSGAIDGKPGAAFQKAIELYQRTNPQFATPALLKSKAEAAVLQPYAAYTLRAEDFRFIKPPKEAAAPAKPAAKKGAKPEPPAPAPVTLDTLLAENFLAYASAWEFVAERFHCDEAFLRRLNPQVKEPPAVGTQFKVPGVMPFEIEKALEPPLQPAADPKQPVTAAIVLLTRLEIYQSGKLIAVMPVATARPGLRGRDRWTLLDAIPQPRLATKREPREAPKPPPASTADLAAPLVAPPPLPVLDKEQFLAPGPNNPLGILWINLAKANSTEPLPYGLHGTSIPGRMKLEGLGGLRLTNWDISRAVRLLPAGTPLQWRAK